MVQLSHPNDGQSFASPGAGPRLRRWVGLALGGLSLVGCPSPPAQEPTGATQAKPLAIAELLKQATLENERMVDLHGTAVGTGGLLGEMNGKMQSHGYFRRVPMDPALDAMDSQIHQAAAANQLQILQYQARVAPISPLPPVVHLQPGQRWLPTLDQLRGMIELRMEIQGRRQDLVAFIDTLPNQVERLIVPGSATWQGGTLTMQAQAYYERSLQAPQVDIRWPGLEERLKDAGWNPQDPQVIADPLLAQLKDQLELGRKRLPDIRRTLTTSADFPRWLLRHDFFEERAAAALAVRGEALLRQAGAQ